LVMETALKWGVLYERYLAARSAPAHEGN